MREAFRAAAKWAFVALILNVFAAYWVAHNARDLHLMYSAGSLKTIVSYTVAAFCVVFVLSVWKHRRKA